MTADTEGPEPIFFVHPDELWRVRAATWALAVEGYALPDVRPSPLVERGQMIVVREPQPIWVRGSLR